MENFIPNSKSWEEELLAEHDDDGFKKLSKTFIEKLENSYSIYQKEIKEKVNNANKILKKIEESGSKSYFRPEILNKQSPLTIIDGSFGTGKTFFLEKFTINFLTNISYRQKFQNIIFIDAWQYVNSKNVPEELMIELFSKLKTILGKLWDIAWKFATRTLSIAVSKLSPQLGELSKEWLSDKSEVSDNITKLNKKNTKTIVVLDNIERLGRNAWDVLKAIQKISQLQIFVFIFPMDLKFLKNNQRQDNLEFPIEKYIDLPTFKFKQDYKGFLKTIFNFTKELEKLENKKINAGAELLQHRKAQMIIDDKIWTLEKESKLKIELINEILKCPIDGKTKSIRQVKNYFNYSGITKKTNKFTLIKKIITEFWGAIDIVEKYYVNQGFDIDTREFMNEFEIGKVNQKWSNLYSTGNVKKYIWDNYLCPRIINTKNTESYSIKTNHRKVLRLI